MFRAQATTQQWGSNLQKQCLPECSLGQAANVHPHPPDQEHPCLTCSPAGGPFAEAQWHLSPR